MSNEVTPREPDDDGFGGSLRSRLLRSSNFLRWTDQAGWTDRDGLPAPSPMLVFAVDEALQRWKDNKPTTINDKPLPDPNELNAVIPQSEWENGIDGKPRAPWEHVVVVCLIHPDTGRSYKYTAPTVGAHIAYDDLCEAVINTRALRGANVFPLVNLRDKPWSTNWGMRKRPHFEIIEWKTPGGGGSTVVPPSTTPQLSGPAAAPTPPASPTTPTPANNSAQPSQARPKPPVNLGSGTLAAMNDAPPATTGEIMDDSVPW